MAIQSVINSAYETQRGNESQYATNRDNLMKSTLRNNTGSPDVKLTSVQCLSVGNVKGRGGRDESIRAFQDDVITMQLTGCGNVSAKILGFTTISNGGNKVNAIILGLQSLAAENIANSLQGCEYKFKGRQEGRLTMPVSYIENFKIVDRGEHARFIFGLVN